MAAEEAKGEAHQQMSKTALKLLSLVALALVATSCGYTLAGRGGTLPEHIRIIGIPQFINRSPFPEIDRIGWFGLPAALKKIIAYQQPFLVELQEKLT